MIFSRTVISTISPLAARHESGLVLLQHIRFLNTRFSSTVSFQSLSSARPENIDSKRSSELNFDDHREIFRGVSTSELVKRVFLFSFLKFGPVARNPRQLFDLSSAILGRRVTFFFLRLSMFRQFCGGENIDQLVDKSKALAHQSLGTIIDYAAEADLDGSKEPAAAWFDNNIKITKDSIYNSSILPKCNDSPSFVAVKATSLCTPELLRRVTRCLNFAHHLFAVACSSDPVDSHLIIPHSHKALSEQVLSPSQFKAAVLGAWPSLSKNKADVMFKEASDLPGKLADQKVSYHQWISIFSPENLSALGPPVVQSDPEMTKSLKELWISGDQFAREWNFAKERVFDLSDYAANLKVRLLMDAEQSFFQPATDLLATIAMEKFNSASSVMYNTYQMYLKNGLGRLEVDCSRADIVGYKLGAKIVRGAYLVQEDRIAAEQKYESPLCKSIKETHSQFDAAVGMMISRISKSELLVGTHNEESVKKAVRLLTETSASPGSVPVSFGQLLGMCDHISLSLAHTGYRSFKYVPYGPIDLVMPYIVRRAEENSSVLGGAGRELALMRREIRQRVSLKL